MILTAWMAWTQAEVDQIRAAVLALATGAREVSVTYAGPPSRSVQYEPVDLPNLRSLLAEMQADVLRASGGASYRLAATRKGL